MKKRTITQISVLCIALSTLTAMGQNLVKNGDAEKGSKTWSGNAQINKEKQASGAACFELSGFDKLCSTEMIPVDGAKTYKLRIQDHSYATSSR